MRLSQLLQQSPLLPVLRGVKPDEVIAVADTLIQSGFLCVEITLNSPDPYRSFSLLNEKYGKRILIAAGTVTQVGQVPQLAEQGVNLVIMPHCDIEIIKEAKRLNLDCIAGFMTPTEAIKAIYAGADALKFFPALAYSPGVLSAIKSVLPAIPIIPTGGVDETNMADYLKAGAVGFGFGGALYKPGFSVTEITKRASRLTQRARELNILQTN